MSLLSLFGSVTTAVSDANSNTTSTTVTLTCTDAIPNNELFQYLMIPSCIEILIMAFTIERLTWRLENCCWRRPALVSPMDLFERSRRYCYVAAFGCVAYLCGEVVFNAQYVIDYKGGPGLRIFVILLSVLCYGIAYFPIFAGMTLQNIPSVILAMLHTWMFCGINYFKTFECASKLSSLEQFLIFMADLPKLTANTVLAILLPVQLYILVRKTFFNHKIQTVKACPEDDLEKLKNSLIGKHVCKNFLEPPKPYLRKPRAGFKGKVKDIALPIIKQWIYYRNPEFRYSARFLSVITVCAMLIYKLTFELLVLFVTITDTWLKYANSALDYYGRENHPTDTEEIIAVRGYLLFLEYLASVLKGCFVTSVVVEGLLSTLTLLHVVSSYRKNLLALHRGDTSYIPPKSVKSNASILLGLVRYGGYQVGFTTWAYLIQWLILFLVCFAIAFIVALIQAGYGSIIVSLIEYFWPIPVTAIVTMILQILVAKFVFLEDRGEYLSITHRRAFFIFTYFMFFYNIFLGLVSCLLRILKAILIGALFLGRLDSSTLPHKFQLFDPGFDAYVGFLHAENAHLHPVLLTFVSILNMYIPPRARIPKPESDDEGEKSVGLKDVSTEKSLMQKRARIRWKLSFILLYNPQLRVLRKKCLAEIHEKLEREHAERKAAKKAKSKKPNDEDLPPAYSIQ